MSTASVARDMISILDAFSRSEDGRKCEDSSLANYWGLSYGTFIGVTFASMFPDRVGRMALDGVIDPQDWVAGSHFNDVTDADDLFSTFFLYCHLAGPSQCPFYTGETAHDIYLRFEFMVSRLNSTYAMEQGWQNATEINTTLQRLKLYNILIALYEPTERFPYLGKAFAAVDAALTNSTNATLADITTALRAMDSSVVGQIKRNSNILFPNEYTEFAFQAIVCTDNGGALYNLSTEELQARVKIYREESYIGGWANIEHAMNCVYWPIKSNYRYSGNIFFWFLADG
jgi:alpha/beta hydrolase fold